MKKNKTEKGITLVALIITIIVLLILAVVVIGVVTGDGILFHAKDASTKYAEKAEEENSTIQGYAEMIEEQTGGSSVTSKDTGPLGEADLQMVENYGKKVNFVSKGDGLEDLVWRIYYADSKNVYLISETKDGNYPESSFSLSEHLSDYSSGADVSSQGQNLMPKGKEEGLFENNTNDNIKGTAYLCDIEVWDKYTDKEEKAAWAIGGPTCDLLEKSFNAYSSKNTLNKEITFNATSKGYDDGGAGSLDFFGTAKEYANGIYRLTSSDNWWLVSPSSLRSYIVCNVFDGKGFVYGSVVTGSCYARPIVCIPVSNFSADMIIE